MPGISKNKEDLFVSKTIRKALSRLHDSLQFWDKPNTSFWVANKPKTKFEEVQICYKPSTIAIFEQKSSDHFVQN